MNMPDCPLCAAPEGKPHDSTCLLLPPEQLQTLVVEWAHAYFPNDTPELRALGVAEETGELCRAFLKRANGIRGTRAEWDAEIRKEMADVVTTCFMLAGYEDFDLWDAVVQRFAVVSTRDINHDPVSAVIGWWARDVNAGRIHEHPETPGRGWSVTSHRACVQVSREVTPTPSRFRRLVEEVREHSGDHAVVGVCPACETGLVTYVDADSTRVRCPSCGWEGWDEQILGNPRTTLVDGPFIEGVDTEVES